MSGAVSAQDIFLSSHIAFVENRPLGLDLRLMCYPAIEALHKRMQQRESFAANPILWWEPGVDGDDATGRPPS